MTTNGSTPPFDAWQVESMRVTAFPAEVVPLVRLSWWDDVVGSPPEIVISRPKTGQYQAQGDFEGRRLALQIQPGRIEWRTTPVPKAAEDDILLLGPLPEVLISLSKVVAAWLPQAPALVRLTFGVVVVQPVENVRTGYALLQKYLPCVRLDLDAAVSDFLFQINRPRPSTTHVGFRMNRLTKWSVQIAQRVIVTLETGGIATRTLGEQTACRLELDINTAPDIETPLPAEQLGALLRELSDLGREIAQRGDVQ